MKSVGLTVPEGFSVSGSPVTTQGNLQIAFANGYSLPKTTDVEKGVTAYGWGDHSQEGYIKAVTYSMVVQALGFAPAEYADVNALQTRMDNAETRQPLEAARKACCTLRRSGSTEGMTMRIRASHSTHICMWSIHSWT